MKKPFIFRILLLFISFTVLFILIKYFKAPRAKSNTIVLRDKPINISEVKNINGYTEIDSINSFLIPNPFDKICWINNNEILLSNFYYVDTFINGMKNLNTETGSLTDLDLAGQTSQALISPLGNKFLYNSIETRPKESFDIYYESEYKVDYNKLEYYSLLDNTSISISDSLYLMEWLPDGSGFIGRSPDTNIIFLYNLNNGTVEPLLTGDSGINMDSKIHAKVSKDSSYYYFSYINYDTLLYSIYRLENKTNTLEKIVSDISIGGEFEVLNNDLILVSNPAKSSIFTYDINKHKKDKIITNSASEFYISKDKSMLVFVEYSKSTKLSVINLNDPNLVPNEIFQNNNHIANIVWSNDNKLAFQVIDYYNSNSLVYTYSFK